jgi:hypothetical protein
MRTEVSGPVLGTVERWWWTWMMVLPWWVCVIPSLVTEPVVSWDACTRTHTHTHTHTHTLYIRLQYSLKGKGEMKHSKWLEEPALLDVGKAVWMLQFGAATEGDGSCLWSLRKSRHTWQGRICSSCFVPLSMCHAFILWRSWIKMPTKCVLPPLFTKHTLWPQGYFTCFSPVCSHR